MMKNETINNERPSSPTHAGEPNNINNTQSATEPNVLGAAPCSPLVECDTDGTPLCDMLYINPGEIAAIVPSKSNPKNGTIILKSGQTIDLWKPHVVNIFQNHCPYFSSKGFSWIVTPGAKIDEVYGDKETPTE